MLGSPGNDTPLSEAGLTLHTMPERGLLATPSCCETWTAAAAAACKGELADGNSIVLVEVVLIAAAPAAVKAS